MNESTKKYLIPESIKLIYDALKERTETHISALSIGQDNLINAIDIQGVGHVYYGIIDDNVHEHIDLDRKRTGLVYIDDTYTSLTHAQAQFGANNSLLSMTVNAGPVTALSNFYGPGYMPLQGILEYSGDYADNGPIAFQLPLGDAPNTIAYIDLPSGFNLSTGVIVTDNHVENAVVIDDFMAESDLDGTEPFSKEAIAWDDRIPVDLAHALQKIMDNVLSPKMAP